MPVARKNKKYGVKVKICAICGRPMHILNLAEWAYKRHKTNKKQPNDYYFFCSYTHARMYDRGTTPDRWKKPIE